MACFDTAFHSSLPKVARMYALPRRFYEQGIFRYGFHGLSYEYILGELRALDGKLAAGRVIIAHLGSGASMVAIKDGKSIDTSMGFTPLEGLVMSTRSGDVDPGLLLYLLAQEKMSSKEVNTLLNKESGLAGVSGTSADMRDLLGKVSHDVRAADAVELFCYRAKSILVPTLRYWEASTCSFSQGESASMPPPSASESAAAWSSWEFVSIPRAMKQTHR